MENQNDNGRWEAVCDRDARFDGSFFFGVKTTGVYCRPSCGARRPLRKNVSFFDTPEQARESGLRACLRCRPDDVGGSDAIAEACRYITDHCDKTISIDDVVQHIGMSRFHFQRRFKATTGLTPRQYVERVRLQRFKDVSKHQPDATSAVYEAGYASASTLYRNAAEHLGMTPAQYRAGGKGVQITYASAQSDFGLLLIGATDRGVCFAQFGEDEDSLIAMLANEFPKAEVLPMSEAHNADLAAWIAALTEHLRGTRPSLALPLDLAATAFQLRVWEYLQSIPYGEVRSYGEVARAIGEPNAIRAVGRACASNRIAVAIPCHRVIRGDGHLGGYRWGLPRKRALLDAERQRKT